MEITNSSLGNRTMKIGTEVTTTVRRKKVTMVVAGFHTVRRQRKTRYLAAMVTGDAASLDFDQVVLVSMDDVRWARVPEKSLRKTGNEISEHEALNRLREVKNEIKSSEIDRRHKAYEAATESTDGDLYNCRMGETIQVKFRDIGWADAEFAGFVRNSGNVRYIRHGRKRTTHPQNVKVKGA